MVERVPDDPVELSSQSNAAERKEVVDVVDDDELRLELADELLDVAHDPPVVVAQPAQNVEAEVVEVMLVLDVL